MNSFIHNERINSFSHKMPLIKYALLNGWFSKRKKLKNVYFIQIPVPRKIIQDPEIYCI